MPVYFEVPHRDYEESLRSLGGLLTSSDSKTSC